MNFLGRFPSFGNLIVGAGRTFLRFPFTLLCAITASIIASILLDTEDASSSYALHKILVNTALGLPLFTLIVIVAEKKRLSQLYKLLLQTGGALLLLGYFFVLPDRLIEVQSTWTRAFLLTIGLHFAVAFLPWIEGKQINGFWQYNKSLLLRFVISALYSTVIHSGLTIALASADHLFGFDIDGIRYPQLWVWVALVFQSWVFLAGVPNNYEQLESDTSYPTWLKIFTQYILLPLVALYFLILFSYEAKIIITWNWPKGWVSQLVLWFSVVGILSLLLLHPLKERTGNRWIKVFTQWFFRALIPLVIMLCLAIFRRISDYGITEPRYFVLVMALALAIVVLYFVFSKSKDIRIIPIILCLIAFLSSFGPWGAFAVSKRDQKSRLISILNENNLLKDEKLQPASDSLPIEVRREISSKVDYLNDWHGAELFEDILDEKAFTDLVTLKPNERSAYIADFIGFELIRYWRTFGDNDYWFNMSGNIVFDLAEYDYLLDYDVHPNRSSSTQEQYIVGDTICFIEYNSDNNILSIYLVGDSAQIENVVELPLREELTELVAEERSKNLTQSKLTFDCSSDRLSARVLLQTISGFQYADSLTINQLDAQILLRLK